MTTYTQKNSFFHGLCLFLVAASLAASGCMMKPSPLTTEEHISRFAGDKLKLAELQNAPTGPISIHEAIARTIKYNLDNRLARMEAAFAMDQLGVAQLHMLPRLALNAGYTFRDNESASSSISYKRRVQTLEPSVSSKRERVAGDIGFSWSLLDFGLSYFQAKQQADNYLILMERRRRITNNLVKEVITAYCRLASLENIRPQVEEAMAEAEKALSSYRSLEERMTGNLPAALEHQRSILTILRQLRQLSTDLAISRAQLGALMNVPHGHDYSIVPLGDADLAPPLMRAGLESLEDIGIFYRPDLRVETYRERIDKHEIKKEIIRLFPGVTLFASANYDSNKYLVHESWAETGARATLDILGLPARIKQLQTVQTQAEVSSLRRLAITVAAIMQIDMSYYQYQLAMAHYGDSKELNRIDTKLLDISSAAAASRSIGRMEHIMQSVSSVSTRLDMDRHMIDVFAAWSNLYFSIGCDILEDVTGDEDLDTLTDLVERGLTRMLDGELPALPEAIASSARGAGAEEQNIPPEISGATTPPAPGIPETAAKTPEPAAE